MHDFPVIDILGLGELWKFDLSTFIMVTVTCLIVFIVARLSVRNLSVTNPSKLQNFMEYVVDFVHSIVASAMDLKKGKVYVSFAMTLILFIFVGNLLGLPFGIVTEHHEPFQLFGYDTPVDSKHLEEEGGHAHISWWKSPTADLAVTFGLATIIFFMIHYLGLTKNRKHYLKHYIEPYSVFLPLNLIKEISKPATLGLRLFANIFAGEILIATILMAGVFGIPIMIVWQGFSIFVGAIQAFLFVMLSMVYIAQATVHEEH